MDALNHLPFVEALATSDDATDDWRRTAAGWVTVRLVDRWLAEGQRAVAANDPGVGALWTALEAVAPTESADKEREALAKVVSAMQRAERPQASAVRDALFGYGRALQDRLAWGPAADVFRMVITQASGDGQSTAPADPELVDKATLRLGGCLRQLGDAQAAGQCYSLVRSRAEARKDSVRAIWARLSEARLIADRGNLPFATSLMESVLDDASAAIDSHPANGSLVHTALLRARAGARHELSTVLHARGNSTRAIQLAFSAWEELPASTARDRLLSDLATYLRDAGLKSAAKDAFLLSRHSSVPMARWAATVNLLELAVDEHDEPTFQRYRNELAQATLPPLLEAPYHMYEAKGLAAFAAPGDTKARSDAQRAVTRAVQIAEANTLNKILFEAEALAKELAADRAWSTPAAQPETHRGAEHATGVSDVTEALRRARVAAGA